MDNIDKVLYYGMEPLILYIGARVQTVALCDSTWKLKETFFGAKVLFIL